LSADADRNDLYSASEIRRLRHLPKPFDDRSVAEQNERIAEIEAAWSAWNAAIEVADE
jgi:hypothetical protein